MNNVKICILFELHQPLRLNRNFSPEMGRKKVKADELFDVYFNNFWNRGVLKRVAEKCYYPATQTILENIDRYRGERKEFKVAYSISGILLEQIEAWEKDLLSYFEQLAQSKRVEFLNQTYYHSISSLFRDKEEFAKQANMHRELIKDMFNYEAKTFENTEFIYNNTIGKVISSLGYKGMFTEGAERILGWRSPNYLYRAENSELKLLLRNYKLSDDIAFRFSAGWWNEYPLTANKFASWLSATQGECINLCMDYETLGEHHWKETGIFEFLRWLPGEVLNHEHLSFASPSEIVSALEAKDVISVDDFATVSWADIERDTGAWLSNDMQRTCFNALEKMQPFVKKAEKTKRGDKLCEIWRKLTISDHLYYMFIAGGAPGVVHGYFSQQMPNDVFRAYLEILSHFQEKLSEALKGKEKKACYLLRILPPEKAMHYYTDGEYTNLSAHSLEELKNTLSLAKKESIEFHQNNKDFERWVRFTVGDEKLADEIKKAKANELFYLVEKRCKELEQN